MKRSFYREHGVAASDPDSFNGKPKAPANVEYADAFGLPLNETRRGLARIGSDEIPPLDWRTASLGRTTSTAMAYWAITND
jgi:hypothetical protein